VISDSLHGNHTRLDFYVLYVFCSQKMEYSGCHGKIFRYTFDQYMFVESTLQRCATPCMANGEVIVLVAVKIMIHGIKIHNFD